MNAPLTVPAILLALVLIFSGVAKLFAGDTTEEAFISLRLPNWLRTLKAPALLPWGELVLAIALLVTSGPLAVVAAIASLVLFLVYFVIIVRALTFTEKVKCSCFGELGLGDVTSLTAVRNIILVALAGLVMWDATRGESVLSRVVHFDGASWLWLALVFAAIALTWLITGRHGDETTATAPMPVDGHPAALKGSFVTLEGTTRTGADLAKDAPKTLVALVSPHCGSCATVIAKLRTWQHETSAVRTVLAFPGKPDASFYGLADADDFSVVFDPDSRVVDAYGVHTPAALLLDASGQVVAGPAQGKDEIYQLMEQADSTVEIEYDLPVTTISPAVPEPEVAEDDYLRRPNPFVLFKDSEGSNRAMNTLASPTVGPAIFMQVSPGCGACESVLAQYPDWREAVAPIALYLVVTTESQREILIERGFAAEAILLDEISALTHMMHLANPGLFAAGADGLMLAGPVSGGHAVIGIMEEIIGEVSALNEPPEGPDGE